MRLPAISRFKYRQQEIKILLALLFQQSRNFRSERVAFRLPRFWEIKQLWKREVEGASQPAQILEAQIPFTSLYAANVGWVELSLFSKLFLGPSIRFS